MLFRLAALALGALAFAGCATGRTSPTLPTDHPANPAAAEAADPPRSDTLALGDAAPPAGGAVEGNVAPDARAGVDPHAGHHAAAGAAAAAPANPTAGGHVCPMHSTVTSDKPGRCPECQMFLVERKDASAGHGGHQ